MVVFEDAVGALLSVLHDCPEAQRLITDAVIIGFAWRFSARSVASTALRKLTFRLPKVVKPPQQEVILASFGRPGVCPMFASKPFDPDHEVVGGRGPEHQVSVHAPYSSPDWLRRDQPGIGDIVLLLRPAQRWHRTNSRRSSTRPPDGAAREVADRLRPKLRYIHQRLSPASDPRCGNSGQWFEAGDLAPS